MSGAGERVSDFTVVRGDPPRHPCVIPSKRKLRKAGIDPYGDTPPEIECVCGQRWRFTWNYGGEGWDRI